VNRVLEISCANHIVLATSEETIEAAANFLAEGN
jgi:hypothetical protein